MTPSSPRSYRYRLCDGRLSNGSRNSVSSVGRRSRHIKSMHQSLGAFYTWPLQREELIPLKTAAMVKSKCYEQSILNVSSIYLNLLLHFIKGFLIGWFCTCCRERNWGTECALDWFVTVRKRSCWNVVFTGMCDSVYGGGVLSQHSLQVVSQHALQQGGAIPACIAGGIPACLAGGSPPGGCLVPRGLLSGGGGLLPGGGGLLPGGWGLLLGGWPSFMAFCCGLLLWPSGLVAFCWRWPPRMVFGGEQKAIAEGHYSRRHHTRRPPQKGWGVPGGDPPRQLLLQVVRILLECILVLKGFIKDWDFSVGLSFTATAFWWAFFWGLLIDWNFFIL